MLIVDSNVLLRLALQDDLEQEQKVRAHLLRLQKQGAQLYLPQVVVLECLWVMESRRNIPRPKMVELLLGLISMDVFQVEEVGRLRHALQAYAEQSVDFVDAYLAGMSHDQGFSGVLSFDKDMGKLGVHWVRP